MQLLSDAPDTQGVGRAIDIWYSTDGVVIDKRWLYLIDTQGIIGDAINIQYSLTSVQPDFC